MYAFGLGDPEAGEVVGCAVVRRDGAVEGAEEFARELAAWVRERAASYKVPRRVELLRTPDLPLTVTGKVSKRLLRQRYEA